MVKLNMQRQQNLTKNQKIVLDIIEKSTEPLKAYSILSTSNQKTKNKLYKTYNYLGYFNNLDACSGIYHFLNFVSLLTKERL